MTVLAPTPSRSPWEVAADLLDPPRDGVIKYYSDPEGFILNCFKWKEGEEATAYQLEIARRLPVEKRISTRGPHGLGKTTIAAQIVLWFALTRDANGDDWKALTTASVWRQLEKFLWPEIHKWARLLDWEAIGRAPFADRELLDMAIKLRTGQAFAVASDDPAKLEGAHGDQLLYIYDEAKTIPPETYDATEGAFSGAGGDTAAEAFAMANSTPGEPNGRFYDIQKRRPGTEDWTVRAVTKEEVIKAGRMSEEWADQRLKQWGKESAVYVNRVLGEFASSEENTVIPLSWVEKANERWLAIEESGEGIGALDNVGADIARSGKDKTVFAKRYGMVCAKLERHTRQGTMQSAGQIKGIVEGRKARATVDVIGIGSGVVDRLLEQGIEVEPFNASERTDMMDSGGQLGFVNCRAASWWNLRELLDPDSQFSPVALPPDDMLTGDLTAPHWRVMSGGRIQVESKEDIIKRLGRSTDDGDAVVMAYWPGQPRDVEELEEFYDPVTIGPEL